MLAFTFFATLPQPMIDSSYFVFVPPYGDILISYKFLWSE